MTPRRVYAGIVGPHPPHYRTVAGDIIAMRERCYRSHDCTHTRSSKGIHAHCVIETVTAHGITDQTRNVVLIRLTHRKSGVTVVAVFISAGARTAGGIPTGQFSYTSHIKCERKFLYKRFG